MSWKEPEILLSDLNYFETLNGLWKGKIEPFVEVSVIRNTNFTTAGAIDYSDVAYIQVEEKQLLKRLLEPGDIILERSGGGPKQPVGRVVLFDRDKGIFSFSNFTSVIRIRDKKAFDPKFIFFGLMELYQSGRTQDIQQRTTGLRNLDFSAYKNRARFPQIGLSEQKMIAHVLSTVQRAIEAQERIIQITNELKKALMYKLFTEGTRGESQKQTEIGLIPESWQVSLLGSLLSVAQYGLSVKGNQEGNYPILRMTNQVRGRIVDKDLQFVKIDKDEFMKYKVERGDILFNRTNSLELVGRTAVHNIEGNYVFASYLIRLRTKERKLDPFFLNLHFNRDETQIRLKSIATRAVGQSNISASRLKGFAIPLPSIIEQAEFVTQMDVVETKLLLHQRKLESLQDVFRTLLHELMTAKICVQDLEF